MNGDMNSIFAMVYEDEFRALKSSLAAKGGKMEALSGAGLAKTRRLDLIWAGWRSLIAWESLDDSSAVSGVGVALVEAALAMIEDQKYQKLALIELCRASIKGDKPHAWALCVDKMKGLPVLSHGLDVFAPRRLDIWEADPLSWIGMATSVQAWACVAAMADLPMAKVGLLGFDKEGLPSAAMKGRSTRGSGCFVQEWHGDDSDESTADQEKIWRVAMRASQDPLLMIWAREASDPEASPPPAKIMRLMSRNGIAASWGDAGFDGAAAALALSGSAGALAGCVAHGIKPEAGMLGDSFRCRRGYSPMASCSAGRYPALAEGISQQGLDRERRAWEGIAEWINQASGEGVAEDFEMLAAFSMLEEAMERGWPASDSVRAEGVRNVLNWLLVAKRPEIVAQERIEILNRAAIDAAEAESRSGKTSPMRKDLMQALAKWAGPMIPAAASAMRL